MPIQKNDEDIPALSGNELEDLKAILDERRNGEFISLEEGVRRTEKMLAEKKKSYGF